MAVSHGDDEPGCSRKRARHQQRNVELIDLVDMELEQSPHGLFPSNEDPFPPAWAKKRTNLWVKDATEFLCLEPNNVGADEDLDIAQKSLVDTHTQVEEFCVNIPLKRMLHSYADYRETCVICYDRCRVLQDAEMEQWMCSDDASCSAVEHVWPLGQGFFAIKFGAKFAAEKVLLDGEMPFNGAHVYVVPYIPCFFPSGDAKQALPVWVTFPRLPLFLRPFLKEVASGLGKVLHISQPSSVISSVLPRACILWDGQKKVPDSLKVSFDELGTMKLDVAFDTINVSAAASEGHESGEEKGGIVKPLQMLLPANDANGEGNSEKEGLLPLLPPSLASSDKESFPFKPKVTPWVSPPPGVVKAHELAVAHPLEDVKGLVISSPESPLLGKGTSKCSVASNPLEVTHALSTGPCLMADGNAVAPWVSRQRGALSMFDNVLYQPKKGKASGKELALSSQQLHAIKEVSSNSQIKQATDSKKSASKYVQSNPGKENNGARKDPKVDKDNIVSRKDSRDEDKSMNKMDHKLVPGYTDKNGAPLPFPQALTPSPKPYYLSPLPYGTPPT